MAATVVAPRDSGISSPLSLHNQRGDPSQLHSHPPFSEEIAPPQCVSSLTVASSGNAIDVHAGARGHYHLGHEL